MIVSFARVVTAVIVGKGHNSADCFVDDGHNDIDFSFARVITAMIVWHRSCQNCFIGKGHDNTDGLTDKGHDDTDGLTDKGLVGSNCFTDNSGSGVRPTSLTDKGHHTTDRLKDHKTECLTALRTPSTTYWN